MRTLFTISCLALSILPSLGAAFPYITLNTHTNRLSDNGTNLTYNGTAVGGASLTYSGITNAMSWSGDTNNVIGGDGRERTMAGGSSISGLLPWKTSVVASDSFNNFTNWTTGGGATWNVSGNTLWITNDPGTANSYAIFTNWFTSAHHWRTEFDFTLLNTNNTSYGIGCGVRSANAHSSETMRTLLYLDGDAPATYGMFYYEYEGSSIANSTKHIAASIGDRFHLSVTRHDNNFIAYATNYTAGKELECGWIVDESQISVGVPSNFGQFAIFLYGGNFAVSNFTASIFYPSNTTWLIYGDSITAGKAATIETQWPAYAARFLSGTTIVHGGSAETMEYAVANLPELKLINPSNLLLMLGGNDVAYTLPYATNYTNVVASMQSNGIRVINCLPTPRTSTDESGLAEWIADTYPDSIVIDTFNPLKTYNATTLRTLYNQDNTHPNELGHLAIGQAVVNKLRNLSATNLSRSF